MSFNVITAPAGSGKTQSIIAKILTLGKEQALPRTLIILPSGMQITAFRARLGTQSRAIIGTSLTDFHTLYRNILDAARRLPRLLPEAARYRLVRHVIRRLATEHQLTYFAPIANKPGLHNAVALFIAELKENLTFPNTFARLASTPRLRDLASIYVEYQRLLTEHALTDREEMGWLARAALNSDPRLYADYDYVAADGFDEFNPTQAAVLQLLAARVPCLDLTLTFQPNRIAHIRFDRTLASVAGNARVELSPLAPPRRAPLEHLEKNLFEWNSPKVAAEGSILLTRAPSREREVREIGRSVKQLLLQGVKPEKIAVLFRRLEPYHSLVREIFAEFGIPFRVRNGMPLASNPLISAMVNLLTLSVNDFPWRATLDALRSPYFERRHLSLEAIAKIERITREAVVVQGRQAWLDAFVKPAAPLREDEEDPRLVIELSEQEISTLRTGVEEFFRQIMPPAKDSLRNFVAFVEGLIGPDPVDEDWRRQYAHDEFQEDTTSLRVIAHAHTDASELDARDLAALVEFKNILRGLVDAAEVLNEPGTEWKAFLSDLQDVIGAATFDLNPTLEGRVVVATATQVRGVPKDFVFLAGLVESEFPPRAPEDPLLTGAERETLRHAGVPLADLKVRDETTLFYEAATLARTRLYLSYPYLDDDANLLYPSPYLESVQALYHSIPMVELRVNATPSPEQSASLEELALSLIYTASPAIDRALQAASPAWRHSLRARRVEARRESPGRCDEFSGILQDAALRAEMADKFDGRYVWSASQFNEWGSCGFRFFASRLLKLEEVKDPEEGIDALQLGGLYHAILQETYSEFARRAMAVSPETLETARGILRAQAAPLLTNAPTRFAFRPTAWWKHECAEIIRRLDALLAAEAEWNQVNAAIPSQCEIPFGLKGKPPLSIELPSGRIRVRGIIDRMDQANDGVVLIDYKSGSTPIGAQEVIQGRNLQLPVYVLAALSMGQKVSNAYYVHIRNGEKSGEYAKTDKQGWLLAARTHMDRVVTQARTGTFAVVPTRFENGACTAYCEFSALCRVGHWSQQKGSGKSNA